MAEISRPHPRLPFITLHIDRPTDDELAAIAAWEDETGEPSGGGDLTASATIEGNPIVYPYLPQEADDEALFASLALDAERAFFQEEGGFLHLRGKAREAAAAGDLETLCLLAEGFGYWRGATEAHRRAAAYFSQSLDPDKKPNAPAPPLSLFAELADPPTILADYHDQQRRRAEVSTQTNDETQDLPF